ncbi:hypothetical protein V2J09_009541 [Rumex salicifolius]
MDCFSFHSGAKKKETKDTKPVSFPRGCTLADPELNKSGSELNSQNVSDTSTESSTRNAFPNMSERSSNLRVFTYQELKSATKSFNRSGRLGEGGFGCVFKGEIKSLEDPTVKQDVAVKQLGKRGLQGHKEWVTEVNFLGVVEHPNLVKLLGYCADDDERGMQRLLVYEYMPNVSVEDQLSSHSQTLSWSMRLRIAQDAARGLTYLHEGMDCQIIFRDFKSSNILLDGQWNAKLSDFGLARFGPLDGKSHVSTASQALIQVVGTKGYAAPEYIRTGRLTAKSDIWSYGVFLYELITGRIPLDPRRPKTEQNLLQWIKPYLSTKKKFQLIVDPRLGKNYPMHSVHKLSLIANRCLITHHKSRPKMSEILELVTDLVPSSPDLAKQPELIIRNPEEKETSQQRNAKRRRFMDLKSSRGGWIARIWRSKHVNAC